MPAFYNFTRCRSARISGKWHGRKLPLFSCTIHGTFCRCIPFKFFFIFKFSGCQCSPLILHKKNLEIAPLFKLPNRLFCLNLLTNPGQPTFAGPKRPKMTRRNNATIISMVNITNCNTFVLLNPKQLIRDDKTRKVRWNASSGSVHNTIHYDELISFFTKKDCAYVCIAENIQSAVSV